jgi:hypothetical protein
MRFHQTWVRHAAIGIGAAGMTVITFGAFVIAPASMGANDAEHPSLAASNAIVLVAAHAASVATIGADAIHERRLGTVQCPEPNHVRPYRMPQD